MSGGTNFEYAKVEIDGASVGDWTSYATADWVVLGDKKAKTGPAGWSAFISLAHDQVPRAWDHLSHILRTHGVQAKCARKPLAFAASDVNSESCGHSIMLRLGKGAAPKGCRDWSEFLGKVEAELVSLDLDVGPDAAGCRPMRGASHVFYRHDAGTTTGLGSEYNASDASGPFHAVRVDGPGPARPMGTDSTLRRLERIQPGWERVSGMSFACRTGNVTTGADLVKALASVGARAARSGGEIHLSDNEVRAIAENWHDAMETHHAILAGREVKAAFAEAGMNGVTMSLGLRRSDAEAPCVRIREIDQEVGEALARTVPQTTWNGDTATIRNPARVVGIAAMVTSSIENAEVAAERVMTT